MQLHNYIKADKPKHKSKYRPGTGNTEVSIMFSEIRYKNEITP